MSTESQIHGEQIATLAEYHLNRYYDRQLQELYGSRQLQSQTKIMSNLSDIYKKPLQTITDRDFLISWGKYKGKSIDFVLEAEPSWLVWCQNNIEWFQLSDELSYAIMKACE